MQRLAILIAVLLVAVLAVAQDRPLNFEVFGGYQFTNFNMAVVPARQNAHGFNADVAAFATKKVSVVADFGAGFKSLPDGAGGTLKARTYSFLSGPRYSVNHGKATPFVEALVGAHKLSVSQMGLSFSEKKFAVAFGAGLDVALREKVSLRLVRFDYLFVYHAGLFGFPGNGKNLNNLRLASGIVYHF